MDRYRIFYETVIKGGISSADSLLKTMMDTAIEVASADRGFLFLARDRNVTCPVARSRGRHDIAAPTEKMSGQILGEAMRASVTLVHEGPAAGGGGEDIERQLSESAAALGVKSFLAMPLKAEGKVVGFGYLDRLTESETAFTGEQRASVKAFFEDMAQLVVAMEAHRTIEEEAKRLRETVEQSRLFPEIVGRDEQLLALLKDVHAAAVSDASVLILGETGTGKELVAHAIYRASRRADRPYQAFNCAAVTRELADSELFGHVRGAFTGATSDRMGLFEEANGGTLFLDEIGDMPLEVQAKLLRVLENGEIRRVGESKVRHTDVRLIAATSRDLGKECAAGRFRRDLLFRLSVLTLRLPPLRERPGDIAILANHFLDVVRKRYGSRVVGFRRASLDALRSHDWPGNVRELENTVERAVLLATSPHIEVADLRLGESVGSGDRAPHAARPSIEIETEAGILTLDEVERRYFRALLDTLGFNRSEVARVAGLPRTTVLARLRKLGLLGGGEPQADEA